MANVGILALYWRLVVDRLWHSRVEADMGVQSGMDILKPAPCTGLSLSLPCWNMRTYRIRSYPPPSRTPYHVTSSLMTPYTPCRNLQTQYPCVGRDGGILAILITSDVLLAVLRALPVTAFVATPRDVPKW